jgi:anti-sigma factor RsiW
MKTCTHVYHHLCDNLDADLSSPGCREIRKHLEQCPDCHAYLDSLKKTITLYRSAYVPGIRREAHRRLLQSLKLESLQGQPTSPRSPAPRRRAARRSGKDA